MTDAERKAYENGFAEAQETAAQRLDERATIADNAARWMKGMDHGWGLAVWSALKETAEQVRKLKPKGAT